MGVDKIRCDEVLEGFLGNISGADEKTAKSIVRGSFTAGYALGKMSVTPIEGVEPLETYLATMELLNELSATDLFLLNKYGMTADAIVGVCSHGAEIPTKAVEMAKRECGEE